MPTSPWASRTLWCPCSRRSHPPHRPRGRPRVPTVRAVQQLPLRRHDVAHRGARGAGRQAGCHRRAGDALQHPHSGRHRGERPCLPAVGAECDRALAVPLRGRDVTSDEAGPRTATREVAFGQEAVWKIAFRLPALAEVGRCGRPRARSRSLTIAVQSKTLAHCTLGMFSAPGSAVAGDQTMPPSDVVNTTPLPGTDAPVEPTAMQSRVVGHETPLSCGTTDPRTACAFHFFPPSLVAMMTVAGRVAGALAPATPTAQHRSRGRARDGAELAGAGGRRLPEDERRPPGLAEDRVGGGRSRVLFTPQAAARTPAGHSPSARTSSLLNPPTRQVRHRRGTERRRTARRH